MCSVNPRNQEEVKTSRAVVPPRFEKTGIPNIPYSSVEGVIMIRHS